MFDIKQLLSQLGGQSPAGMFGGGQPPAPNPALRPHGVGGVGGLPGLPSNSPGGVLGGNIGGFGSLLGQLGGTDPMTNLGLVNPLVQPLLKKWGWMSDAPAQQPAAAPKPNGGQ